MPEDSLPHIITSIEKKLFNPISENPFIHLVVYVPACDNSPLHIYNKKGFQVSENNIVSFSSEKWGGVVIDNPSEEICLKYVETQEKVNIVIKTEHVAQVLLQILRRHIYIDKEVF